MSSTPATRPGFKPALFLFLFFLLVEIFLFAGKSVLEQKNVNVPVLHAGNILLFLLSVASQWLYQRALLHATTAGFLRNTYSGLFLKLLVCIFVLVIYLFSAHEKVNKAAIIGCIILYFIYLVLETRGLMQWNKARQHG